MGVASGLFIFTLAGYSTGALVGIYRLTGDVMQVFGPIAIGPILDAFGFKVSFLLMAGFGLLALASLALRPGARQTSPAGRLDASGAYRIYEVRRVPQQAAPISSEPARKRGPVAVVQRDALGLPLLLLAPLQLARQQHLGEPLGRLDRLRVADQAGRPARRTSRGC